MPIIKADGSVNEPDTKGKTRGVYFNIERTRRHREIAGREYLITRNPDGTRRKPTEIEVYQVPDDITEFARDAIDILTDLIDTWEPIPQNTGE